jgi:AraC-like DNA-binding protein
MNSAVAISTEPVVAKPRARRNLYYPSVAGTGFVFACTKLTGELQLPFIGMLVIAADSSGIRISVERQTQQHSAMAVWKRKMHFDAPRTRLVCIAVNPAHPLFRAFSLLPPPHILDLDRSMFASLDELLNLAVDDVLTPAQALELFDKSLAIASEHLPPMPAIDSRAQELVAMLYASPDSSLDELADHLQLSNSRTSHLFAEAIGIPVRTYRLWRKIIQACTALLDGASVTEAAHVAGFSDSAHFSSAYQRAYGGPPTELFMNEYVKVYAPCAYDHTTGRWLVKRQTNR